jgi:hypothetical protein
MKALLRQLSADFQTDAFVGAGDECDCFRGSMDAQMASFQEPWDLPAKNPVLAREKLS